MTLAIRRGGRRSKTRAALALCVASAAAAVAQDAPAFDREVGRFAGALQAAGGPGLAALEAWNPAGSPPGALADIARRVASLPLPAEAVPRITALVASDDPFLQEAGLVVARGQVEQGLVADVARSVEGAAAKAVRAPGVDPWVVLAAVELVDATADGPLEELLAALAEAVERGPAPVDPARPGPAGSRMKPVADEAYARAAATLGRWLGQAGTADAAILALFERRHGTKGLEATRRAVSLEERLRRVHLALSMGDRRAAAWALDQARELAADGPRAAEVELLSRLLGGGAAGR